MAEHGIICNDNPRQWPSRSPSKPPHNRHGRAGGHSAGSKRHLEQRRRERRNHCAAPFSDYPSPILSASSALYARHTLLLLQRFETQSASTSQVPPVPLCEHVPDAQLLVVQSLLVAQAPPAREILQRSVAF